MLVNLCIVRNFCLLLGLLSSLNINISVQDCFIDFPSKPDMKKLADTQTLSVELFWAECFAGLPKYVKGQKDSRNLAGILVNLCYYC